MGSQRSSVVRQEPPTYADRVRRAVIDAMNIKGASQVDLAIGAAIPRATLQRRLAGAQSFLLPELERIARHLDVPLLSLVAPGEEEAA